MKKRNFIKIIVTAVPLGLIEIYVGPLFTFGCNSDPELRNIHTLRPGEDIKQVFTAKVRINKYRPGEHAGFKILDVQWQRPFWYNASIREKFAVCHFGVGCPQDVGRYYEITGYRLPSNVIIPEGELKTSVPGDIFYEPTQHRRL